VTKLVPMSSLSWIIQDIMTDKGIHLVKTYMLKANMTDNTMFVMLVDITGQDIMA